MLDALDTEISGWEDIEPLYDAIRDTARERMSATRPNFRTTGTATVWSTCPRY
jgi:hypothetical protein